MTSVDTLTKGMNALLLSNKEIENKEENTSTNKNTKVVKLRFTKKQYEAFRDACKVMEIVSSHEGFDDFVKSALNADIKVSTIASQFVNPIVEAPLRIPVPFPKRQSGQKKVTYFTSHITATDKCIVLYHQVEDRVKDQLKDSINNGVTTLTDVKVMINAYLVKHNLKTEYGVLLNEFICLIVPNTIEQYKNVLPRIENNYVIPKGDRKIMANIVNEIAFGDIKHSI